jgi:hypothetical protein
VCIFLWVRVRMRIFFVDLRSHVYLFCGLFVGRVVRLPICSRISCVFLYHGSYDVSSRVITGFLRVEIFGTVVVPCFPFLSLFRSCSPNRQTIQIIELSYFYRVYFVSQIL